MPEQNRAFLTPGPTRLLVFSITAIIALLVFNFFSDCIRQDKFFALYLSGFGFITLSGFLIFRQDFSDVFTPALVTLILLFLYTSVTLYSYLDHGHAPQGKISASHTLVVYCQAVLLGVCGIFFGEQLGKKASRLLLFRNIDISMGLDNRIYRKLTWAALVSLVIFLPWTYKAFDFFHAKSYYMAALSSRVEYVAAGPLQPIKEVFLREIPILIINIWALMTLFRRSKILLRLLAAAVFGSFALTLLLTGARSTIAMYAVAITLLFHYRLRRITLGWLAVLVTVGIIFVQMMSFARSSAVAKPLPMIKTTWEVLQDNPGALLPKDNSELLSAETFMRLVQGIQNGETEYTWGSSVLSEALVYVPRVLYPNRPQPLSYKFLDVFYPKVREMGGGYGFFYLGDGYWAFGLPGVFLFMMLFMALLQTVHGTLLRLKPGSFAILCYGFVYYPMVMSLRGGIFMALKAALMNLLPLIVIIPILGLTTFRRREGTGTVLG